MKPSVENLIIDPFLVWKAVVLWIVVNVDQLPSVAIVSKMSKSVCYMLM